MVIQETEQIRGQALWWFAGDEESAQRRFRERFGIEPTLMAKPQPGIVALGPLPGRHSDKPQQMTFFGGA
jgi:hypothetical protein